MIQIVQGDILQVDADAAVLSAHPTLIAGGGLSHIFHEAAGPELELAAKELGPIKPGEAVSTPGFQMRHKHVIHAVAPRFKFGVESEVELLRKTYRATISEAMRLGVRSIVVPSIGTGIYRWPLEVAVKVALEELGKCSLEQVIICAFEDEVLEAYLNAEDSTS